MAHRGGRAAHQGDRARAGGLIRETRVGASRWMVLPVRDVTELYRQALLTEGSALYGL